MAAPMFDATPVGGFGQAESGQSAWREAVCVALAVAAVVAGLVMLYLAARGTAGAVASG